MRKFGDGKEIAARIYVCPTRDAESACARSRAGRSPPYLSVPTYRAHQEWLGNARSSRRCGSAGPRATARARAPRSPTRSSTRLYIHGPAEYCRERIEAYRDAGLDTPIIGLVEEAIDPREAVRLLAPR